MKTKETKSFDSVAFFRAIKEKLAKKMEGMNLVQKKKNLCNKSEKEKLRLHNCNFLATAQILSCGGLVIKAIFYNRKPFL